MATFLFVAGGNLGGWVWRKVRPLLRDAGHEVHTPTLTGLGERTHLLSPEISLETHIDDVGNVLEYEDLRRVVLVGHSYAGMVIAGVADRSPERLACLVFLDAVVPRDGESELDLLPRQVSQWLTQRAREHGEGWYIPPPPAASLTREYDEADARWLAERLTAHPLRPCAEPVRLHREPALPRTFISCTRGGFESLAERARGVPGWRFHELDAGHNAMVTAPEALARLLLTTA